MIESMAYDWTRLTLRTIQYRGKHQGHRIQTNWVPYIEEKLYKVSN
jgi:hypothetical protein